MIGGYMGKLLRVDLSTGETRNEEVSEEVLRKYIGGVGIGARILFDETSRETDPFGEGNLLMFLTGPLTNTKVPTSGRYAVVSKSPLGAWGESDSGGSFGPALKQSGFDGVIFSGIAEEPVYLYLNDGRAVLRKAQHLWGKDTYVTDALIKGETSREVTTVSIGPAGEKLARIAGIINNGRNGRASGRGGLGAVMGSKRLKAIAAHGHARTTVAREAELANLIKAISKPIVDRTLALKNYGTAGGVLANHEIGDLPIKNFTLGEWAGEVGKISGEAMHEAMFKKRFFCGSCIIGCGRLVPLHEPLEGEAQIGGGPEYESLGALGSLLLVNDLEAIAHGHELCNRYGLDVISAGAVIAFAMEAHEKGLLDKEALGGTELVWGNAAAMIEMIHKLGKREGIGRLLGEGVKHASETLHPATRKFAIHSKGLEFPMHDPRSLSSFAVSFATSPRGACHRGCSQYSERMAMPELGFEEPLHRQQDEGKGVVSAVLQNYSTLFNSLKLCHFVMPCTTPTQIAECLRHTTGWHFDLAEFLQTGERIFNLKKLYNLRMGLGRRDDDLPERIKHCKLAEGGAKDYVPDLERMLAEYYNHRGWDSEGTPELKTLERLGLHQDIAFLKETVN